MAAPVVEILTRLPYMRRVERMFWRRKQPLAYRQQREPPVVAGALRATSDRTVCDITTWGGGEAGLQVVQQEQGQPQPDFKHFGEALRYYRETIADRIRRYVPGRLPDLQLSAKDVVNCMKEAGYTISQAAYSDIEQGQYLPRDPGRFMETVVSCLALDQGSPEYLNLMDHLLFDTVAQRMGPDAAVQYRQDIRKQRGKSST